MAPMIAFPALYAYLQPPPDGWQTVHGVARSGVKDSALRCGLLAVLLTLLAACSASYPASDTLYAPVCYDDQNLCYTGHVIDNRATRDRYGVHGLIRLNQDNHKGRR